MTVDCGWDERREAVVQRARKGFSNFYLLSPLVNRRHPSLCTRRYSGLTWNTIYRNYHRSIKKTWVESY